MGRTKEAATDALHAVSDGAAAAKALAHDTATATSGVAEAVSNSKIGAAALAPGRRAARLPNPVRFALAVVLSFALSSLGRSFVDHVSSNEVGAIAREDRSDVEGYVLAGWKLYVCLLSLCFVCFVPMTGARSVVWFALPSSLGLKRAGFPFFSSANLTLHVGQIRISSRLVRRLRRLRSCSPRPSLAWPCGKCARIGPHPETTFPLFPHGIHGKAQFTDVH